MLRICVLPNVFVIRFKTLLFTDIAFALGIDQLRIERFVINKSPIDGRFQVMSLCIHLDLYDL